MFPVPTRPDECVIVTLADGQRESDVAYATVRDFMEGERLAGNAPTRFWSHRMTPGFN